MPLFLFHSKIKPNRESVRRLLDADDVLEALDHVIDDALGERVEQPEVVLLFGQPNVQTPDQELDAAALQIMSYVVGRL